MHEKETIELILQGDEKGLRLLEIYYYPLIRYIVSPILGGAQEQEECISEITTKIWNNIQKFDSTKGSWNAWITAIARNTALNRAKKIRSAVST